MANNLSAGQMFDTSKVGSGNSSGWDNIGASFGIDTPNSTAAVERRKQVEQMEFQQYMSNTAHQREMQDLEAAGLNPVLTATGGSGASTPSGSNTHTPSPENPFNVINSALKMIKGMKDVFNTENNAKVNWKTGEIVMGAI